MYAEMILQCSDQGVDCIGFVSILNRIATVVSGGLEYEADQWHAEILMEDMANDEGSKGVVTPGSNGEGGQDVEGDEREQVPGSRCERKLVGSRQDGHAVRSQGDLEVYVKYP